MELKMEEREREKRFPEDTSRKCLLSLSLSLLGDRRVSSNVGRARLFSKWHELSRARARRHDHRLHGGGQEKKVITHGER